MNMTEQDHTSSTSFATAVPFSPDSSLLNSLLHSLPLNVYAKDREGRFLFANKFFCESVGKTPEDILGKTDYEVHPGELAQKYLEDDRYIMETGGIQAIEEKWQTLGGSEGYVRVVKAPLYSKAQKELIIGTIGIFWDITERKQAENALAEERNLLRVLIDNLPDYIYVKDKESRIILANKAQINILGRSVQQEVLGRTDFDFYDREEAKQYFEDEQRLLNTGRPVIDKEEAAVDGEGRERWTLTTKIPFHNTENTLVGLVGIGHDITRRKREEKERQHLEAQLQQARKMESVGTLTAGIAHDFNNLLSVINGYTELLQISTADDHPQQEIFDRILQAGRSAADLVGQLLAFSRKQIALPRIVNLNTGITNIQQMLRRIIGENIEIILNLRPDLWSVKIDPAQLEQIILNLATNARDAMPYGGTLTLATDQIILDDVSVRQHAELLPGRYVEFSVSDNGLGIPDDIQEHIFEPFYTTKDKHRGTGLGLATVFGIVKQNCGHIWLSSKEGEGSTFRIFFPQASDHESEDNEVEPQKDLAASSHESILVVEDEPSLQDLAKLILEGHGYSVTTAANGQEALMAAENRDTPFDLLLTDVIMPGMSGRILADQLSKSFPALKVLYMSGYTDDAIVHYGMLEPGIEFIHKPFSPNVLAGRIRSLLDKKT